MSNTKTNKFEGALPFILSEFASVDCEDLEDGCMEVFGEDEHGNEGSCEVEINELAQAALDEITHLSSEVDKYKKACERHVGNKRRFEAEISRLEGQIERDKLPNEKGTNEYGLDVAYFRKTINRELNRDLGRFKPDELARVFARLSKTADASVMHEKEFSGKFAIEQQVKGIDYLLQSHEPKIKMGERALWSIETSDVDLVKEQISKGGE